VGVVPWNGQDIVQFKELVLATHMKERIVKNKDAHISVNQIDHQIELDTNKLRKES